MADKTCYLLPTEEISLADQMRRRTEAIIAGKQRASELWKVSVNDLTARDADYVNDFIAPAAPAAVAGIAGWLSMPLAAVGTWYSVFATNVPGAVTPICPTNQVWVFYKAANLTPAGPDAVCGLEFRKGTAANLMYRFDMENLNGKMVDDGYFSQVVTYQNPDIATVQVECRVAIAAGARIKLGCFIIETMQTTVI